MKTNFKKWPMECLTTNLRRGPQRDGLAESTIEIRGLAPDAFGLMLEVPLSVRPAHSLPPDEFEARILFHQNRIAADLARMEFTDRGPSKFTPKNGVYRDVKNPRLPYGVKRDSLKLVSCARCSKPLLGESCEPIRAANAHRRFVENLPPPVAASRRDYSTAGLTVRRARRSTRRNRLVRHAPPRRVRGRHRRRRPGVAPASR